MYLHPLTLHRKRQKIALEGDQDIDVLSVLQSRDIGRVMCGSKQTMPCILFLDTNDIDKMEEDMFLDQPPAFQRFIRSLLDYAQANPPSTVDQEYVFMLDY